MGKLLVSEVEAAEMIGMSRQFLRKSRMNGVRKNHTPGPPYVRIGRAIRYELSELERFIEEHRCPVRSGASDE